MNSSVRGFVASLVLLGMGTGAPAMAPVQSSSCSPCEIGASYQNPSGCTSCATIGTTCNSHMPGQADFPCQPEVACYMRCNISIVCPAGCSCTWTAYAPDGTNASGSGSFTSAFVDFMANCGESVSGGGSVTAQGCATGLTKTLDCKCPGSSCQ